MLHISSVLYDLVPDFWYVVKMVQTKGDKVSCRSLVWNKHWTPVLPKSGSSWVSAGFSQLVTWFLVSWLLFLVGSNSWPYLEPDCLEPSIFPGSGCVIFLFLTLKGKLESYSKAGSPWPKQVMFKKVMTWGFSWCKTQFTACPPSDLNIASSLNLPSFGILQNWIPATPISDSVRSVC